MASIKGNKKVAKTRGNNWRKKLAKGHMDATLNPSKIYIVRVSKGFSQEDMSRLLKISMSSYGAIERGKRLVKKARAVKIATILEGNIKTFFKSENMKFLALKRKLR